VDRLFKKGLVSRVDDTRERHVRIVSLTEAGTAMIKPIFQSHVKAMNEIFSELDPSELGTLEA
jgi:MarR family 2-MHQ and catechol resistance regulon transcriptional repressor